MDLVFLIVGIIIGVLAAYLIAKSKFKNSGITQSEVDDLRSQINSVTNEKGKAEERDLMSVKNLELAKSELAIERDKVIELNSGISKMNVINSNLEQRLQEQKADMDELQKKFTAEFENLANKILDEKSRKFTEQNKENLNVILNPLREKISDFEKKVNEVYVNETKERASLAEQIRNLHDLNKQMTEEANNLTKALKGDTKTQGSWGEFILESLLEKAGLVKGREFTVQETFRDEDGVASRPDVIISLPDNKSVVIDSKVSLTAYEQFASGENDEIKKIALKEHVSSIKRHIKNLSPKEYQKLYGLQSLDFVLMFIPIEPAFYLAMQNDNDLYSEGVKKNILIISPSSLFPALKTIASMWKQERQNKNALEIAKKSGDLYDKLVAFVEDLIRVGSKMDDAKKSYEDAMKRLSTGKLNIIERAENLRKMGAKNSKLMDQRILDKALEDEDRSIIDERVSSNEIDNNDNGNSDDDNEQLELIK